MAASALKQRVVEIACDIANRLRDVPQISVEELQSRRESSAAEIVLVDVRSEDERAVSTIPGAITLDELDRELECKPGAAEEPRTVVAYCTAGYRSGVEVRRLLNENVPAVNLRGGMLAWCNEELPLVDANGDPTRRVHVHGKAWNLVPDSYEAVW